MDGGAVDVDKRVRLAAFDFLGQQTRFTPDGVLSRTVLATGFPFDGIRVLLSGPQGIFKPAILPEMPLSIITVLVVEGKPQLWQNKKGTAIPPPRVTLEATGKKATSGVRRHGLLAFCGITLWLAMSDCSLS